MRLVFGALVMGAFAYAQDPGIAAMATKLGTQLSARKLKSVALLHFTNTQNFDAQLSGHLVDEIVREMGKQFKGIEVPEREKTDAMLRELRLVDAPEINSKDLETIAARLSVEAIVTGTFNATGQAIALDATIFDGKTSFIIGAASAQLNRAGLDEFLVERKGPAAPTVGIPSGMEVDVKLSEKIDAAEARNGRTVAATLDNDITVRGVLLAKAGTEVKMRATSPDGMELRLTLVSMVLADQRSAPVSSDQVIRSSTMVRQKDKNGLVVDNAPVQAKPGEAALGAQFAFHLNQDVR